MGLAVFIRQLFSIPMKTPIMVMKTVVQEPYLSINCSQDCVTLWSTSQAGIGRGCSILVMTG